MEDSTLPIAVDVQVLREELPSSTQGSGDMMLTKSRGEEGDKLTQPGVTREPTVCTQRRGCAKLMGRGQEDLGSQATLGQSGQMGQSTRSM